MEVKAETGSQGKCEWSFVFQGEAPWEREGLDCVPWSQPVHPLHSGIPEAWAVAGV